jgi:hypothetical protein
VHTAQHHLMFSVILALSLVAGAVFK